MLLPLVFSFSIKPTDEYWDESAFVVGKSINKKVLSWAKRRYDVGIDLDGYIGIVGYESNSLVRIWVFDVYEVDETTITAINFKETGHTINVIGDIHDNVDIPEFRNIYMI